jgi:YHS domain-containing protein
MQKHQDIAPQLSQTADTAEPVMLCGRQMTVHPDYAITEDFQGRTLYFCTQSCLHAFRADPERFYCAHSKTKPK